MSVEVYLGYLLILAVFFATPPDTSQLLFMSNSIRFGVRRSLATMAGDLSANTLQMSAAAFGLTALIAASSQVLTAVKWIGVCYLAWLGVRIFFAVPASRTAIGPVKRGKLFQQGFITSAANPYAVFFFAALFPQFIDPAAPIWPQLLILGVTYVLFDAIILLAFGVTATKVVAAIGHRGARWVNRVSGLLMVGAAVLLALKDVAPLGGTRAR